MKGLTKKQHEIVSYIQEFITTHSYSPSYREIMLRFGFSSPGSVYKHIYILKRKGVLISEKQGRRSLAIASDPFVKPKLSLEVELPFLGYISAGRPIETLSKSQTITVPESFVNSPESTYVLRVKGNNFEEEQMADGDLLIVEARQNAYPGQTIVVLVNQTDTLIKRYYPEEDYVRLESRTSMHKPIILRSKDIKIQGVVVTLLRMYH